MPRQSIVGSRRGRPLLPLSVQRVVCAICVVLTVAAAIPIVRGDPDAYHHEHARLLMLSVGVTLMAAAGLARRSRTAHVALFAAGGVCLGTAVLLR